MTSGGVQAVLDLVELGEDLYRQRLRREEPGLTEPELDVRVGAWRRSRPGAPDGDAEGPGGNRFAEDR
jgi:hypothetical protein